MGTHKTRKWKRSFEWPGSILWGKCCVQTLENHYRHIVRVFASNHSTFYLPFKNVGRLYQLSLPCSAVKFGRGCRARNVFLLLALCLWRCWIKESGLCEFSESASPTPCLSLSFHSHSLYLSVLKANKTLRAQNVDLVQENMRLKAEVENRSPRKWVVAFWGKLAVK